MLFQRYAYGCNALLSGQPHVGRVVTNPAAITHRSTRAIAAWTYPGLACTHLKQEQSIPFAWCAFDPSTFNAQATDREVHETLAAHCPATTKAYVTPLITARTITDVNDASPDLLHIDCK